MFGMHCNHENNVTNSFQPGLTDETRKAIGEAAVRAARAVHYVGAGTEAILADSLQIFRAVPEKKL